MCISIHVYTYVCMYVYIDYSRHVYMYVCLFVYITIIIYSIKLHFGLEEIRARTIVSTEL